MLYMFYETLTPSMIKEFFYPDFSIIFIEQTPLRYVVYDIWNARWKAVWFFINQDCMSMYVTHLFDLIYPQKARYKYIKNFLNESFHMSVFFIFFNKGICVCTVAQYIMRSIAVFCCCNLIMLHSSRSAIT